MRLLKKLSRNMGFRGAFLLFLAVSDFFHSVYYLFGHPTHAPIDGNHFWGAIFLLLGMVLLTGVFVQRDKGFFVISGSVMTIWALNYLWAVLDTPYQWGLASAWLMFSLLSFLVLAWPEPPCVLIKEIGTVPTDD